MSAEFERQKNVKASAITFGIAGSLLLLFIMVKWPLPSISQPPAQEFIEVNLGSGDLGSGTDQPLLPGEPAPAEQQAYNPPTPEDADELHSMAMAIVDDLSNVAAYVEDFSVEMQNLLVADLFGSRVEHRRPIDPSYRVITLRDAAPLERYFLEETEWGRWVTEEEARAVERLEGKGEGF